MRPIDYRNETFEALQARGLVNERLAVYNAFRRHGPGTTRKIASLAGIDILNLRPRATELYQLGFLKLVAAEDKTMTGSQGVYRAYTYEEARAKFFADRARDFQGGHQPELSL